MTARRCPDRRSRAHRLGLALAGAAAAAVVIVLPMALPAGAQVVPVPAAPDAVVAAAAQSVGIVTVESKSAGGWVAGEGLVITADTISDDVGGSASFAIGRAKADACYVAMRLPALHLALLRCSDLDAPSLDIASGYPEPGTPIVTVALAPATSSDVETGGTGRSLTFVPGIVTANDVKFMEATRLQLSTPVSGPDLPASDSSTLTTENSVGAPVLDAEGNVVSTVITSPVQGGQPLGATPRELTKAVETGEPLPETFSAAAVLSVARRALIPAAVGLVLGLLWGVITRNGNILAKSLGLMSVGLVGAVAYSLFAVLVVGPESLIG